MITKTAGSVALHSPGCPEVAGAAATILWKTSPWPPNLCARSLKCVCSDDELPNRNTMKAMNVPIDAIAQKLFCHRKTAFVPAIRIAVISTIIAMAPKKIHHLWVWKLLPHRIRSGLLKTTPSVDEDRAEAEHGEVARPERRADQRREGGPEVRDDGERGRQDAADPDVVAARARHAGRQQRHHDQHRDVEDEGDQGRGDQVAARKRGEREEHAPRQRRADRGREDGVEDGRVDGGRLAHETGAAGARTAAGSAARR